jgi:tRNA (guanine-N7-)-methyltransferase
MADRDLSRPQLHGRRHGRRLRTGQRRLLAELLPRISLHLPERGNRLAPLALFRPGTREVWLEIGFGAGEHLAWQAAHHRDVGLIGAEFFVNGIAALLGQVAQQQLENIRIYEGDGRMLLDALPERSIARAFVLFPDPWPKGRHAKRRFVSVESVRDLARVMLDGGELRLASDDPSYICWMLEHLTGCPEFEWQARRPQDWRDRPLDWPQTRYEEKALKAGRRPAYLSFRRRCRSGE